MTRVPKEPQQSGRLAGDSAIEHYVCMKRTNLVLDVDLLKEATRLSGEKTYSSAVMRALEDFVRRAKARQILELRGSGLWEGDLSHMRRDRSPGKRAS
jgi:Arc/MetJ family transcription regulator